MPDRPEHPATAYAPLRRLNLNLLYSLDAILNARTLTEAGERVLLSQPSMSAALRRLRDQFDDPLVLYTGSERAMTPLAEMLRPRVRQLLKELEETFELKLSFDPARSERTVRIAATEEIEITLLAKVIPHMLAEAPGMTIEVLPLDGGLARAFDQGADLVVVSRGASDPRLPETVLIENRLCCMVWENREGPFELSIDDYLAARHVAFFESTWPIWHFDAATQALLASRNVVVRTSLHGAFPGLVVGSDLVVTGSGWLLQYYSSMMPVRVMSAPFAHRSESIVMQWQPHRERDPVNRWLRGHVLERVQSYKATS